MEDKLINFVQLPVVQQEFDQDETRQKKTPVSIF